jgi:CelD/BcsL family acetyltransferase involved in cellulose biosynthesis
VDRLRLVCDPLTSSAQVETYASLEALPADAGSLFATAVSFFSTRAWWDVVLAHAIPPGAQARPLLIRVNGEAAALFPMLHDPADGGFRALTTPYTCLYEPLIDPARADRELIFAAFARFCRSFATVRMDALDQSIEADVTLGAKRAGVAAARFEHFGNWHEDVTSLGWAGYLASRPGTLRETIRRRSRRGENLAEADFRMFCDLNDIETGVAAFQTVYARSWKQREPFPAFNPAQIRAAAALGMGRLAVWSIAGNPVAVQFWIVEHGRATILKLAHDEAFKAHSPGTVLTAWMIRHMIEQEHVTELDFGRGDDPYKQLWAGSRRQRIGLMLINPRRAGGMLALARHTGGRLRARLRPTG